MFRRRPLLARTHYYWKPEPKPASLRFELILDGAIRRYPDGREVCQDSPAGMREYKRRIGVMLQRQNHRCCLCGGKLSAAHATFEHQRRRGMGAAWRDDRITKQGEEWNGAAHWVCNREKG